MNLQIIIEIANPSEKIRRGYERGKKSKSLPSFTERTSCAKCEIKSNQADEAVLCQTLDIKNPGKWTFQDRWILF